VSSVVVQEMSPCCAAPQQLLVAFDRRGRRKRKHVSFDVTPGYQSTATVHFPISA